VNPLPQIDRRTAMKWMLTAYTGLMLAPRLTFGQHVAQAPARGYGTDPNLTKTYQPGELWPLTLTPAQRELAAALCDLIIPADAKSPSASQVGVVDFLDEWISAPYEANQQDRRVILDGLTWLDGEAHRRFGGGFVAASVGQRAAICDEICFEPRARPDLASAARFFARYRDLTAGGFYTTPEGMKDVGYIGNVPLATFDGPPAELLRRLGLEQSA
jgi:hypothetical protein